MQKSGSNFTTQSISNVVLPVLLLVAVFGVLWYPFDDGDIWWHIAAGNEIVENGSIPVVDEWTYTAQGKPYVYHSWLSEAVFSQVWNTFGSAGLESVKYAVYLLTCFYAFFLIRRFMKMPLALLAVLILAYWLSMKPVRPHIVTPLFSLVIMDGLFYRLSQTKIRFISIMVLMLLWANLHGGFVIGLAFTACLTAASGIRYGLYREPANHFRWFLFLFIASFGATLINPYGTGLYEAVYQGMHNPSFDLLPVRITPFLNVSLNTGIAFLITILFGARLMVRTIQNRRKEDLTALLMTVFFYGMALSARRLEWILFFPLCLCFQEISGHPFITRLTQRTAPLLRLSLHAAVIVLVAVYFMNTKRSFTLSEEESLPVEFVDYLEDSNLQGNVFCPLTWSGRVILATNGRLKVYIDGRLRLHPPGFFNEYAFVSSIEGLKPDTIRKYPIDYLLISYSSYDAFIQRSAPILWKPLQVFGHAILLQRQTPVQ